MKRTLAVVMFAAVAGAVYGQAPNTLTAQEQKEGWMLLFDGRSLDKFALTPEQAKAWKAENGVIKTDAAVGGGTIVSKEEFDNFILKAEFRAHPDINSGIMLRQPRRRATPPGEAGGKKKGGGGQGYELQIRDKDPGNYTGGSFLTASIVNVAKAPADAKIKPNEWNTIEVTMNGDHMVVVYNGRKVVEAHDGRLKSGGIGLQLAHPEDARHANIEFRNLKIKRLGSGT